MKIEKLGITPGPWFIRGNNEIMCNDKYVVPFSYGLRMNIADVWDDEMLINGSEQGNAMLIAAAPEMLEALIMQMDLISTAHISLKTEEDFSRVNHAIENVIEKATGKTWQEIKELIK